MSVADVTSELTFGSDGPLLELRHAILLYKQKNCEYTRKRLTTLLEGICVFFCYASGDIIRRLLVDRYASLLVWALTILSPHDHTNLCSLTLQAIALFVELVPRGSSAIVTAKGVQPLLRLLKETKTSGNEALLEELLKCISHVALDAYKEMVCEHVVSAITALEARVKTHHLRMLCLKCLCHFFSLARTEDFSPYFIKSCNAVIMRLKHWVSKLLDESTEQLSKENETYLMCLIGCVAIVYDRLLRSEEIIVKYIYIVGQSLPVLVNILTRTSLMGTQGAKFRDAVCSPLLKLFLTYPAVAVKVFLKHRVFPSLCGTIIALLGGKRKRYSRSGMALAEAFFGSDVNDVPLVAEEQQVVPLLEFLLVIIPATLMAREGDYYVTMPHFTWQWEDDFHNRKDCNESLSRQLEGEYEKQRRLSEFLPYEIHHASRLLKIDFMNMRYSCNEEFSHHYTLARQPILSGYIHKRIMWCTCKENFLLNRMNMSTILQNCNKRILDELECLRQPRNNLSVGGVPLANVAADEDVISSLTPNLTGDLVDHNMSYERHVQNTVNRRLVDGEGCSFFCINNLLFGSIKRCCQRSIKRQRGTSEKGDVLSRMSSCNTRENILRSLDTRTHFVQLSMIQTIVSWCLPMLVTVINQTVNPVIARHCSILILRCVDLTVEYFRQDCGGFYSKSFSDLRMKFNALSPHLGSVLLYLVTTGIFFEPAVTSAKPFKEFQSDKPTMQALVTLGFRSGSRVPAMTLGCEIQMSALSAFLILQLAYQSTLTIFSESQRFMVSQMIEKHIDPSHRHQSIFRSSQYGTTGVVFCSFHDTVERIEEAREILLAQVLLIVTECTKKIFWGLSPSFLSVPLLPRHNAATFHLTDCQTNPFKANKNKELSQCSDHSIIANITARAEKYVHYPSGVQLILAIYNHMRESDNDLFPLVYENPEFLNNITNSLRNLVAKQLTDAKVKEAFIHVKEGLVRVINEHVGLISTEKPSTIECQRPRMVRCFQRDKVLLTVVNHLWTPLRVKVERTDLLRDMPQTSYLPSLVKSLFIGEENYTILDISVKQETLHILPMVPLVHLAKRILLLLHDKYVGIGRNSKGDSESKLGGVQNLLSFTSLSLSDTQTMGDEDDDIFPFETLLDEGTSSLDIPMSVNSPRAVESMQQQQQQEEAEEITWRNKGISDILSVAVPTVENQKKQGLWNLIGGRKKFFEPSDDSHYNITLDNIVFLCNGKPVTDLSVSLLELCWASSSATVHNSSETTGKKEGGVRTTSREMRGVLALWSVLHTITYVIVKEPVKRDLGGVRKGEEWDGALLSPIKASTQLSILTGVQNSLEAAAHLLNEMLKVLRAAAANVGHVEGRLCSALIYSFYNCLSVHMLPPLVSSVLWPSMDNQREQHLVSCIFWNYPHIFSLDIRRMLFQLLHSIRRVETTSLAKFKEKLNEARCTNSVVMGLEWVTSDLNIKGTKKVVVWRDNIFETGAKVLRTHAMCPLPLSVQFQNENGVGIGPAMEFYNLFSHQLQEKRLCMWRTEEFIDTSGISTRRVCLPLFPAAYQTMESLYCFELLGLLVGRILCEERVIDLQLHPFFIRGIMNDFENNLLCDIDSNLDHQLNVLKTFTATEIEACELTFVLPHSEYIHKNKEIELCPNGTKTQVLIHNVSDYIKAVKDYYCKTILIEPIKRFIYGLSYIINPHLLKIFNINELQLLISGPEGKIWEKEEDFNRVIITSHGYDKNSPVVMYLLEVVSHWEAELQRAFLRFVTGSSRIPVGGLHPPITIVRRNLGIIEEGDMHMLTSENTCGKINKEMLQILMDASLPTVNTCTHYLKLPNYSNKTLLQEKLRLAVTEGQESFLLT